jgi:hypothetical protein
MPTCRDRQGCLSSEAGRFACTAPAIFCGIVEIGGYAKKEHLITENVDPNSDCRVKERLKTGCIVRIVGGVSTAFANRRCSVLGGSNSDAREV